MATNKTKYYPVRYYLAGGKVNYQPEAARFKYDVYFYVEDKLYGSTQVAANRLLGAKKQARTVKEYLIYNGLMPKVSIVTVVKRVYDQEPVEPIDFTFKFSSNGHTNDRTNLHRSDGNG